MSHKTAYYFQIHKTFYLIKVDYSTRRKKIKITVQTNKLNQIYQTRLYEGKLPMQVVFYGSIDNVYLALEKSQELSFNFQQKRFQFEDLINNKPTKISLQMRKLGMEQKAKRRQSKFRLELEQEIKLLKLRYDQAQQNFQKIVLIIKQTQKQILIQQNRLKTQRCKVQEIKIQNQQLRQYCRFYKKISDYTKQFDILMKKRTDPNISYSKPQNPSPESIKGFIEVEQKLASRMEIRQSDEAQQSYGSFIEQIDESEFKKAFYDKQQ